MFERSLMRMTISSCYVFSVVLRTGGGFSTRWRLDPLGQLCEPGACSDQAHAPLTPASCGRRSPSTKSRSAADHARSSLSSPSAISTVVKTGECDIPTLVRSVAMLFCSPLLRRPFGLPVASTNSRRNPKPAGPPCRKPRRTRFICPALTLTDSSRLYSAAIARLTVLMIDEPMLPSLSNCSAQ